MMFDMKYRRRGGMDTGAGIGSMLILIFTAIFVLFPEQPLSRPAAADVEADVLAKHLDFLEETPFVTKAVFRNGMKILVNENRAHPVVSIQLFVRAGILDEPRGGTGLARLLTGMIFRGGPDQSSGTPEENARLLGGFLSGSTGYRYTKLEIDAPAPQWESALKVHSAAVLNGNFDPVEIATEARLLREEAWARLDDPSVSAREAFLEFRYGSSGFCPWKSLIHADAGLFSPAMLADFHRKMYVPERMILAVSGDVNAVQVIREAAVLYGDLASSDNLRGRPHVAAPQEGFRYRSMLGNPAIPNLLFGFDVPGPDSREYAALEVLNAILGLGNGSVLSARLRDRKGLVYEGRTELSRDPAGGILTVYLKTAPKDIDRCELALFAALELLKRKAPDAADMERAWAQLEQTYRSGIETASGRARMLAQFEIEGDWKRIDRHLEVLRRVKPEEVQAAAAKYFRLNRCSLLEYLPNDFDNQGRTARAAQSTISGLLKLSADQEQALREKEIVPEIKIPGKKDDYAFSPVQYPFKMASILRGPEIFIREDHTTPMIYMGLFYPGGRLEETEQDSGITDLMLRVMLQGTEKRDAFNFYRQLEILGGRLIPVVEDDYFGFYFSIKSKNFSSGFRLFGEALKQPSFEEETVERQKAIIEAERVQYKGWKEAVDTAVLPALFGNFPYSRVPDKQEESLKRITPAALKDWYERNIKNLKPVVVIVGDSIGTNMASYFVRDFSGSRFRDKEIPEAFAEEMEATESVERTWKKNCSLAAIGFQAPPLGDMDLFAVRVLRQFLENRETNGSRIAQDLDYGLPSVFSYEPRLRGGSFIAYAVVHPGSEKAALEALEKKILGSTAGPFPYRDYRAAVNTAAAAFQLRQQSPFLQITDVALNILAGEGIEGYRSFRAKLLAVEENEVIKTSGRIMNPEKSVRLLIYGNRSSENHADGEKPAALEN